MVMTCRDMVSLCSAGLDERSSPMACTGMTGWGRTAGAPDEEDHVKGQACLVCKRNGLLPEPHLS